jgi:hypothetical protein
METYNLPVSYQALGGIKDAYRKIFLANEDIRELVMPEDSDLYDKRFGREENWYGGVYTCRNGGKTETVELTGHCFDVPYVRDTITDNRIVICIDTYLDRTYNSTTKTIDVMINVLANKDGCVALTDADRRFLAKMRARGYTGNRLDMAVAAIIQSVTNAHKIEDKNLRCTYGIGGAVFASRDGISLYQPNVYFSGKQLIFSVSDFYITPNTAEVRP